MKRLLVIGAFVVVLLGVMAGGAYLYLRGDTTGARKPVVAKEADLLPDAPKDNSGGPLGSGDDASPDGGESDGGASDSGETTESGETGTSDNTPVKPDHDPAKPEPTETPNSPKGDVTKPNPDGTDAPEQPEIIPTEGLVTLAGRVVNDIGEPIAGAGLTLDYTVPVTRESRGRTPTKNSSMSFAATDNDGFYRANLKLVFPSEEGELEVQVYAGSGNGLRSTENRSLTVKIGGTYEHVDFTVPRGGALMGQVVNQRFESVAGAKVFAQWTDGTKTDRAIQSTTDENGAFQFDGLKPGSYQVFATIEGYQPDGDIQVIEVASADTVNMTTPIKMKPYTGLKVRLVSTHGQPSGNLSATFYNADGKATQSSAKADREGNAIIGGVPEDAIEMVIKLNGYQTTDRIPVSVIKDDHNDLGEIQLLPSLGLDGD